MSSRGERALLLIAASLPGGKERDEIAMEMVQEYVRPLREFAKDSMRLVKRCTKPDLKGESL